MLAHLSSFAGYIMPFGNIVGPLLVWLLKKDESAFVAEHAKEALNFQISLTIYIIVSALLMCVLIGFVLLPALLIADVVLTVMAAVAASNGTMYRYPLTIRFVT
jgi:uncharacterized Tic20 family protein